MSKNHKTKVWYILIIGCYLLTSSFYTVFATPYVNEDTFDHESTNMYCIDRSNDQVLLDIRGESPCYVASLTKLMSTLLVLEHYETYDKTIMIKDPMIEGLLKQNASVAGFYIFDEPTIEDLLYGIMLPSGADAVNALAIDIAGSIDAFVDQMNEKAKDLHMDSTHFANPNGMDHKDNYSTCKDIAILFNECLNYPMFHSLLQAQTYITSPVHSNNNGIKMYSSLWSYTGLKEDPFTKDLEKIDIVGLVGGKTGYTKEAGKCLATNLNINGMDLICVTTNANDLNHIQDTANIANHLFKNYQKQTIAKKGDAILLLPVSKTYPKQTIEIKIDEDVIYDLPKDCKIQIEPIVMNEIKAPLKADEILGSYKISVDNHVLYKGILQSPYYIPYTFYKDPYIICFGILLFVVLILICKKKRK